MMLRLCLITLTFLIQLLFAHPETSLDEKQSQKDSQAKDFNKRTGFELTLADGSAIKMKMSESLEKLTINATIPTSHYLLLYFLGYAFEEERTPSLFSMQSLLMNQTFLHIIIWQAESEQNQCIDQSEENQALLELENTIYQCSVDQTEDSQSFSLTVPFKFSGQRQSQLISYDQFQPRSSKDRLHFMFTFEPTSKDIKQLYLSDQKGRFWITVDEDGHIQSSSVIMYQQDFWKTHGWACWLAWSLCSLASIWTMRFGKVYWRNSMQIHIFLGLFTLTSTLFFTITSIMHAGRVYMRTHAILGIAIMFIVIGNCVIGFVSLFQGHNQKWDTTKGVFAKRTHKVISYTLIIVSQVQIQLGITLYERIWNIQLSYKYWNIILFFVGWFLLELHHGYRMSKYVTFVNPKVIMSIHEFQERCKKGEQLCLLDDLVLDISYYQYNHPGGKYSLERNYGRDISKFFYGAQQMENNYVFAPKAYNHSNLARMIINQLCVARLEFKVASALAMIGEEFDDIRKVKNNIQTFRFRSFNKQFNWKRYYSDINTTGKHFKISPLDNPSLKRMYVVNNCMRRKFRDELIKVCDLFIEKQGKIEPHQLGFDFSILDDSDLNEISVTIKNYNAPKGLSRQFFFYDKVYEVSGPMGKGLQIQENGVHIAFTGGTGALVFIDIVAHLILRNLGLVEFTEQQDRFGYDDQQNSDSDDSPTSKIFLSQLLQAGLKKMVLQTKQERDGDRPKVHRPVPQLDASPSKRAVPRKRSTFYQGTEDEQKEGGEGEGDKTNLLGQTGTFGDRTAIAGYDQLEESKRYLLDDSSSKRSQSSKIMPAAAVFPAPEQEGDILSHTDRYRDNGLPFRALANKTATSGNQGSVPAQELGTPLKTLNYSELNSEMVYKQKAPDFRFILYCSLPSPKDAFGLELPQRLLAINEILKIHNFELKIRFSTDDNGNRLPNNQRWDANFIEKEFDRIKRAQHEQIKRVWVCGPPQMTELFDKTLEQLMPRYGLTIHDYEIM